jgi:A/G-specific adenine glycosylase
LLPSPINIQLFRDGIIQWWEENKRDFPWRYTRDPYRILAAEVLLHRTRADQVAPVYQSFLDRFPSVNELALASSEEIRNEIKTLGLFWRIDLMREMAQELVSRFDGNIPSEKDELESLPGVSHYIATAVRCFAYRYPDAILDTNTVRICGRFLGIPVTDGSRRSKKFRGILEKLVDPEHPRSFNFAMIDLGALVCKSRNPSCSECPVKQQCFYWNSGR